MRVDIERIKALKAEFDEINKMDLDQIQFYEKGNHIEISQEQINEWKFIGLSNVYFILDEFYKMDL